MTSTIDTIQTESIEDTSSVNLGPIICPGHSRPVPDISFSSMIESEYFLMSGGLDKMPMLRRGDSGDWIGTFQGHKGAVWSARLNSEANNAVTASGDFTVKLWDAITGSDLFTFEHRHIVKTAVFSINSKQIFTGGHEKKVRVFDLENTHSDPQVLLGHDKIISNVVALPTDSQLMISSGDDQGIRVWDLRTGSVMKTLETSDAVASLEVSKCGTLLTSTSGKNVQFWDMAKLELSSSFTLDLVLKCASLHPNKRAFVTGSMSELWVRVYDFETGEQIGCQKGHHGPVRSLAYSPLGDAYASGSEDGTIRIWESSIE